MSTGTVSTEQWKDLYDALLRQPTGNHLPCTIAAAYMNARGGAAHIGCTTPTETVELGALAWLLMNVPNLSEKLLCPTDLDQFVMLLERAHAAYHASQGTNRYAVILTDNIVGL